MRRVRRLYSRMLERYVVPFPLSLSSSALLTSPVISIPSNGSLTPACAKLGFVGIGGLGGGLSEYFSSPEAYLHRLPPSVSLKAGAMAEPLAVAVHAVKRSGFREGMSALVVGAGAIGCFIAKVLVAQGASCVSPSSPSSVGYICRRRGTHARPHSLVIVSEPSSARREKASLAGAHHLLSPLTSSIPSAVKVLTNGAGVDVAFEAAGVERGLKDALEATRVRGTVCNVSVWSGSPKVS